MTIVHTNCPLIPISTSGVTSSTFLVGSSRFFPSRLASSTLPVDSLLPVSHVFVDSSRLLCFLIAPPGHHCVRLLSVRAVSRRWAAFLSAPSSSLDCLVDEISGLPRTPGDVLLMTRSPEPSPSHRNHQIVSSARTAALRRIRYQRQAHVSNQLAPFFCSHPLGRAPHYLQSMLLEHRHERLMQLRTHCTIAFKRVPNSFLSLITETHHKHISHPYTQ